jgi:putative endonuclease
MTMKWQVYIILCSDNSLYTGITTDIERRFRQHAEGNGAKYFRGRQPLLVVYLENNHSRSSAAKRESQIKAINRAEKTLLVSRQSTTVETFCTACGLNWR